MVSESTEISAVRKRVIDVLASDLANSYMSDGDYGASSLAECFKEGFLGFAGLSNLELAQGLRDAGLDERYNSDYDHLMQGSESTLQKLRQMKSQLAHWTSRVLSAQKRANS